MKKILSIVCITILALITTQLSSYAKSSKPKPKKCASGIISSHGQCWICSKESRDPIRIRVEKAKTQTNKLGACKAGMSSQQIQERKQWWNELHKARNAENQCWQPSHSAHVTEARKALAVANACDALK